VCSLPKDESCQNICKALCPTEDCAGSWVKSGETKFLSEAMNATSVKCFSRIGMTFDGLGCSAACVEKTGIAGCAGTAYCCYPDSSMPDSRCSYLSEEKTCGKLYCCN